MLSELIMGNLYTGSNFDDSEEKVTADGTAWRQVDEFILSRV